MPLCADAGETVARGVALVRMGLSWRKQPAQYCTCGLQTVNSTRWKLSLLRLTSLHESPWHWNVEHAVRDREMWKSRSLVAWVMAGRLDLTVPIYSICRY